MVSAPPPTFDATEQEVDYVTEQIEDRAGPRTLALMLCVTDDEVQRQVREYARNSPASASIIVVESNRARYQTRIDALSTSGARRLIIIFSTNFNAKLSFPSEFTSCEIVCCNGSRAHFSEDSTYCGIRLGLWSTRHAYSTYSLLAHPFVYYEMVEPDVPETPPPYQFDSTGGTSEAQRAARAITSKMKGRANVPDTNFLVWLAGGAGLATTGMALLIMGVKISVKGVYLQCQTAAFSVTAMPFSVSASASAAAGVGASLGAGIAVAAAIYFIPWKKLATLMERAWDHFVKLIGYLWKFLGDEMELLSRLIQTIVVVLRSGISRVVDEVARCIEEFIFFVSKNFPSLVVVERMLLSSSTALGNSSMSTNSLSGPLALASLLL